MRFGKQFRTPMEADNNALIEKGQFETQAHLFEGKPVLLKTFDAETHDEAAQIYNDYFGWGKYHPMKD